MPLSCAQERLWFMHRLDPTGSPYNLTSTSRLRGAFDQSAFEGALRMVSRRHAVLHGRGPEHVGNAQAEQAGAQNPRRGAGLECHLTELVRGASGRSHAASRSWSHPS